MSMTWLTGYLLTSLAHSTFAQARNESFRKACQYIWHACTGRNEINVQSARGVTRSDCCYTGCWKRTLNFVFFPVPPVTIATNRRAFFHLDFRMAFWLAKVVSPVCQLSHNYLKRKVRDRFSSSPLWWTIILILMEVHANKHKFILIRYHHRAISNINWWTLSRILWY